jgi:hypothetical protein
MTFLFCLKQLGGFLQFVSCLANSFHILCDINGADPQRWIHRGMTQAPLLYVDLYTRETAPLAVSWAIRRSKGDNRGGGGGDCSSQTSRCSNSACIVAYRFYWKQVVNPSQSVYLIYNVYRETPQRSLSSLLQPEPTSLFIANSNWTAINSYLFHLYCS